MEDLRIGGRDVEERFKNAYLLQIQYYLNRVWIKIVGVTGDIDLDKYVIEPRNHGGQEEGTIKQLIMEEATYIKENGTEYKNPVEKVQRIRNGGGWQLTGKKQELSNLAHFGYQVLPELLKEWCGSENLSGTHIGMIPRMRQTHEKQ